MKAFIAEGTGAAQQLSGIQNEKIPIYENESALDADISNLEVGQIVGTKSGHDDVIDQMKAYIRNQISPDWANATTIIGPIAQGQSGTFTETVSDDGWIAGVLSARYTSNTQILINNIAVGGIIGINNAVEGTGGCFAKVNKGDEVKVIVGSSGSTNVEIKFIPHK